MTEIELKELFRLLDDGRYMIDHKWTEEEKQQILRDKRLRELVERTIEEIGCLEKYFAMIFCYGMPDKFLPLGTKSYENTKPIPWVNWDEVHAKLQRLLKESK